MQSPSDLPVTLIVIAHNEARALGRCLDSVPFAAEKLVIDSGSTDGTPQVAAAHGARVVHQDWLGFGPQRNFATTQSSNDWILSLDADEALSPELVARCDYVVRIPTSFCVNLAMAGAIVMYDRVRSLGRFPPRPVGEGGPAAGTRLPRTKIGRRP